MNENETKGIVEKVKELVRKGNVSRIVVRRGERELLNIPVNAGIVGGAVTLLAAKWVLLAGVLNTVKDTVKGAVDDFEKVVSRDEEQEEEPEEEPKDEEPKE